MDESRKLASFSVGLKYEALGAKVIEKTKDLVLDQIGVQLASSTKPWSKAVYQYARSLGGPAESTILNYGDKVKAENAVFANATFGHGFEMDDTYLPGNSHPGCIVVTSALACGEKDLIDGKGLIAAIVAGYEVMDRVARSVAPSFANRGFHTTPGTGPFAAAAVTGKILGFNEDLMLNALSIAGSHCAGIGEFSQTGGSVKRMHAGMAAMGGIRSALLARAGLTGPPTVLEGKKGFCKAFADSCRLEELGQLPGEDLLIMRTSIKQYSCCYQIHGPIDGTRQLMKKHSIKPEDIEEIIMGSNQRSLGVVGTIREPKDIAGAQFSAAFSLAMQVVRGSNFFNDYVEENLDDPEIMKMAKKVRLEVDKEAQAAYPLKRASRVTIKTRDGKVYQQWLEGAHGTPEDPMSRAEVQQKFRSLASVVLPDERVKSIIDTVEKLDTLSDVSVLTRLLVR